MTKDIFFWSQQKADSLQRQANSEVARSEVI